MNTLTRKILSILCILLPLTSLQARAQLQPGDFIKVIGEVRSPESLDFGPDGNLYLASSFTGQVLRFDGVTNAAKGSFAEPDNVDNKHLTGLDFGPDGDLYVLAGGSNKVLRFDGMTGAAKGIFLSMDNQLNQPRFLIFGPDGNLYISDVNTNEVLRFDGVTGAAKGAFIPAGSSGLLGPMNLAFGPDGDLYVSSHGTDQVLRYDGATGAARGAFVSTGSAGLTRPTCLAFGPDGDLYVCSSGNKVLRYDGATGAAKGLFILGRFRLAMNMVFGPGGDLYIVSLGTEEVQRYAGRHGADVQALTDVYIDTDGDNWFDNTGWFSGPLGTWQGVTVNEEGDVIGLDLAGNRLVGEIPPSMGGLVHLVDLHLENNRLRGSLPSELGNMISLRTFSVFNNQLEGNLPESMKNLGRLKVLNVNNNPELRGTLPVALTGTALEEFRFALTELCENEHPGFQSWRSSITTLVSSGCTAEEVRARRGLEEELARLKRDSELALNQQSEELVRLQQENESLKTENERLRDTVTVLGNLLGVGDNPRIVRPEPRTTPP